MSPRAWLEGEFKWAWQEGPILGMVLVFDRRHTRGLTIGVGFGLFHFAVTVRF